MCLAEKSFHSARLLCKIIFSRSEGTKRERESKKEKKGQRRQMVSNIKKKVIKIDMVAVSIPQHAAKYKNTNIFEWLCQTRKQMCNNMPLSLVAIGIQRRFLASSSWITHFTLIICFGEHVKSCKSYFVPIYFIRISQRTDYNINIDCQWSVEGTLEMFHREV